MRVRVFHCTQTLLAYTPDVRGFSHSPEVELYVVPYECRLNLGALGGCDCLTLGGCSWMEESGRKETSLVYRSLS